jgi:recombination protein RecR
VPALPLALERLAACLGRLPGIGERSAQRLAFHILAAGPGPARDLAGALADLHPSVGYCRRCHHLAEGDLCAICQSASRRRDLLCVVEGIPDLLAIERTGEYQGLYFVLHGLLSPLRGLGPADLCLGELVDRLLVEGAREVIVATPISVEGEATAAYLQRLLGPSGVTLSRIASGVPHGAELEYIDASTLGRAIRTRQLLGEPGPGAAPTTSGPVDANGQQLAAQ